MCLLDIGIVKINILEQRNLEVGEEELYSLCGMMMMRGTLCLELILP